MSHAEVLVTRNDYTEDSYATCGHTGCTSAILRALGVPGDPDPGDTHNLGDGVTVEVSPHESTDMCVHCAACGDFIEHGLSCEHPQDDWGNTVDEPPAGGPHIDLRSHPAMAWFRN